MTIAKQSVERVFKTALFLILSIFVLSACSNNQEEEKEAEESSYSLSQFFDQVHYPNEEFSTVLGHYQDLLQDYPVQPFAFEDDQAEKQNHVTEILNNFQPGPKAQYNQIGENEEYLFYEFGQDDQAKNYIGLYFVNGGLVQAGLFTDQTELEESDFIGSQDADTLTTEESTMKDLAQHQPTLLAYSQMNFEGQNYHLPAYASLSSAGGEMLQLSLYNQDYQFCQSDILGMQYLQAASINNSLINQMLSYYTEEILGLDSSSNEADPTGGSLMDYQDFQSTSQSIEQKASDATADQPLTLDQVLDEMGEPMKQGAGAVSYQSQNPDGAVESFTVIYDEDEKVSNLSRQIQSKQLDFPFDEESIQALSYMEVTTPIESIEENYAPAHYKEYNVETEETIYMWTKEDPDAKINVVQIIYGPDGQIKGVAFDGNQEADA